MKDTTENASISNIMNNVNTLFIVEFLTKQLFPKYGSLLLYTPQKIRDGIKLQYYKKN